MLKKITVIILLLAAFWFLQGESMEAGDPCGNTAKIKLPTAQPADETGWEAYDFQFIITPENAEGLNPGTGSPEAVVIQFYASIMRGDECYKNVIPENMDGFDIGRALEEVKSWEFLEVKLLKRKIAGEGEYWVKLYMKIKYKGDVDSGTDEATVTKIGGRWLLTDPPT